MINGNVRLAGAMILWGVSSALTVYGARPVIEMKPGLKQLFLDDFAVQKISRLRRTMHTPRKFGAVLKPDIPSDGFRVESFSAPMWVEEEQRFKFIYMAVTPDGLHNGGALAFSTDGIHWEKPNLGQELSVHGCAENNRIFFGDRGDAFHWGKNCLWSYLYDPDDPDPARRYKGLLGSVGRVPVVSPDGIHWTQMDAEIPSNDVSTLTHDRDRRRFLAFVKGGNEYGRAFNVSVSADFAEWRPPRFCFGADAEDQRRAPDIIRRRLKDPGLVDPFLVDPDPELGVTPAPGEKWIETWCADCQHNSWGESHCRTWSGDER